MLSGRILFLAITLLATHFAAALVSLEGHLDQNDKARLQHLFNSQSSFKDPISTYWALKGLGILNALPKDQNAICQSLKSAAADSVENIFYITESAKLIKCTLTSTAEQENALKDALTSKKVSQIYYAVNALSNLKVDVPADAVLKSVDDALKTDDSPTSYGYAFLVYASYKLDVTKKHSLIEDVYAQADIMADKYMQFEGGLYTTALVVESSFKLAAAAGKAPSLTADQVVQLSNYLVSRKHVQRLRSAVQMLSALQSLADNQYFVPVSIHLGSGVTVPSNAKVVVSVSNIIGDHLGKATLTADSGKHIADSAVVLSKKQLTPTSDPSRFELDFSSVKGPFGSYSLDLSLSPSKPDKRLISLKASLRVQSVTDIKLEGVEVGVVDSELGTSTELNKVDQSERLSRVLNADAHQMVLMKFTVKSSSTNEALVVHQTFVRLTHKESNEEIIFVATPDEITKQYKFEMRVGQKARDFGSLSGVYSVSLVVGDAIVANPIDWHLADIDLKFPGSPAENTSGSQRHREKPSITHMFREPETRPPAVVSNVFTGLVLAPFLIMLILWIKIGANISNLPSVFLSAVGFHASLAAIFSLYFMYWTTLNMFDTMSYLTVLAVPTFLFGNRLLGAIADRGKAK